MLAHSYHVLRRFPMISCPFSHRSSRCAISRYFSTSPVRGADFDHVVIGGGVVGLAIASSLVTRSSSVLLLERRAQLGTETSSRNSEVIHAGIYYPPFSLKDRLCRHGRDLLYDFSREYNVPHKKIGKWIVAQNHAESEALDEILKGESRYGFRLQRMTQRQVMEMEPAMRVDWGNGGGVLFSSETGIIDVHSYMLVLAGLVEEAGGVTALNSTVTDLAPVPGAEVPGARGWEVSVADASTGETSTIVAENVVNAAGLASADVANMAFAPHGMATVGMRYAKGNYFSYSASNPKVSHLIYPAPVRGAAGLGTHLTLDLAGRIRFGPDVEWVEDPADLSVSTNQLPEAVDAIRRYLPAVDRENLTPDYCGIRPKLVLPESDRKNPNGLNLKEVEPYPLGFVDFVVRAEERFKGWVNCLGIESPGLTSSLAIGKRVMHLVYGDEMPENLGR